MRHRKRGKKFHRLTGRRRSFLRNLANDLIRSERIETTEARAKAIRPIVERLVSRAKRQDLGSRRILFSRVHNETIVRKLADVLAGRYRERAGGYLRIVKLVKARKRDGSRLVRIEFVE